MEGVDIYRHDEEEDEQAEAGGVPRYYQESAGILHPADACGTPTKTVGDGNGIGTAADEMSVKKEESGLLGPNGLLATPHVKVILLLGCITSVSERSRITATKKRITG